MLGVKRAGCFQKTGDAGVVDQDLQRAEVLPDIMVCCLPVRFFPNIKVEVVRPLAQLISNGLPFFIAYVCEQYRGAFRVENGSDGFTDAPGGTGDEGGFML